jgi:hypothetical protein
VSPIAPSSPSSLLRIGDGHHAAITIPSGRLIRVIGPAEDDRFLVIEIDGERFQAFETDLKSRCSVHAERGQARASRPPTRNSTFKMRSRIFLK